MNLKVRTTTRPCGVSASAHWSRGARQGDPLSPLLFNLLTNDLVAAIGPGSPVVFNGHGSMLYADDVAMLRLELLTEESSALVDEWAANNEMDFDVSFSWHFGFGERGVNSVGHARRTGRQQFSAAAAGHSCC